MTMAIENHTPVRTHRGTGIASFVIGAASVTLLVGLIGTYAVMARTGTVTVGYGMLVGLSMIAVFFVDVVGLALGIVGAASRSSKKVYPVLGLLLNALIMAFVAAMVAIGLSLKGH